MEYKTGNIDLHVHSTASDGSLKPVEVLALAQKIGLAAFALTDHDSLEGTKEVLRNGIPDTIGFLTGVEISSQPPAIARISGSFHILGYGIAIDNPHINTAMEHQQNSRKNRNPHIISRLNALGFDISLNEVEDFSRKSQIGRPHIASLMVEKKFVRSIDEAFDKFLGNGKPAYIDKPRIPAQTAIELIRSAGGVSVLAHPGLLQMESPKLFEKLIDHLIALGLDGIEVYYPSHSHSQTNNFAHLAEKYHLLATGGTDFHGEISPDIRLGSGHGNFNVPYSIYETLLNSITRTSRKN